MAKQGWLWSGLAKVSKRTRTPVIATWLVIVIILILALWLPIEDLAKGTSYLILIVFILVNASLIAVKRRLPPEEGILNIPLWVPVAGLISSVSLTLFQLFS
jgi:amino acid transporter